MGSIQEVIPVKLLIGVLTNSTVPLERVDDLLAQAFGPIDYRSPAMPFTYTEYYTPEMGGHLQRLFYSFATLIDPGRLAEIKRRTNEMEKELAAERDRVRRPVNLDPGYMEMGKLILASTKNHCHRIYLQDGIYAELTLLYRQGSFLPLEWTYPDYRAEAYHVVFGEIRKRYRLQLKQRQDSIP